MANEKRIDMKQVVASPVLTGNDTKFVWTGVVQSKNIKDLEYIVPDPKKKKKISQIGRRV